MQAKKIPCLLQELDEMLSNAASQKLPVLVQICVVIQSS